MSEQPNSHVSVAALVDAIGRIAGGRWHIDDLVSPTPGRTLVGQAATIRYTPIRQDLFDPAQHSFARFFYEAIPKNPKNTVLVLDAGSARDTSVGGGTKFSRLENRNLAGLLTGSRIRDFTELKQYSPVFYCSGEAVAAGTGTIMPIAANGPVSIGGITIMPGDTIHADHSGAVVIPAALVEQVYTLAEHIESDDRAMLAVIRDENPREMNASGRAEN